MKLSHRQKALLHMAAAAAGIDDEQRRLIQMNLGGCRSAAGDAWTREGFCAVMAFYEDRAGGCLKGNTPGYWRGQDQLANPTDALVYRVRREAAALGMTDRALDGFLASSHMSSGACQDVATAPAYWLRRLLQGLLAMKKRRSGSPQSTQRTQREETA